MAYSKSIIEEFESYIAYCCRMEELYFYRPLVRESFVMSEVMSRLCRCEKPRPIMIISTPTDVFSDKSFYDRWLDCPNGLALKAIESVDFKDHTLSMPKKKQATELPTTVMDRMKIYLKMKVGE